MSEHAPAWPMRIRLARDTRRLAALVGARLAIGAFGVVSGAGAGGVVGTMLMVAGSAVLLYGVGIGLSLASVRVEVIPTEIHLAWPMRRARFRLVPGPVTRLRSGRRGGWFGTQLGGFGIEFGPGRIDDEEPVTVLRLDPRVPPILIPTEGQRLAIAVADEPELLRALTDATRLRALGGRGRGGRPLTGIERSRVDRDRAQ